ncbi:4'-phosphopantetheinyl transferase superfamily protein [Otariodibacter sp.]|uniref:4'-phosphopantetheinyl transferase family protein n=1 Tax=Otariodibacter sp. TaxID=3030919 RepID=UPI00261179BC|nr:4'-phosphopantetheinyl transferase superfamily protein [Otariodibacter sp.]
MNKTDRLDIVFAHHNEIVPDEFLNYAKPIQSNPSEKLIKKWKSRRVAHFILYQLFEKYQLDTKLLDQIYRTSSDRPYILHPQIDFNISHSGDWVAVIFRYATQQKVVGIDIEHPQKIRRYNELLNYYASAQEIDEINTSTILPQLTNLTDRFYLSWCLREAILKSQGVGIVKLSEVKHSLSEQKIISKYCPQGQLFFYHQLPFYLAYFIEQEGTMLSLPNVTQWQNGQFHSTTFSPIIYQVN